VSMEADLRRMLNLGPGLGASTPPPSHQNPGFQTP
jgi:hypothetical protein